MQWRSNGEGRSRHRRRVAGRHGRQGRLGCGGPWERREGCVDVGWFELLPRNLVGGVVLGRLRGSVEI